MDLPCGSFRGTKEQNAKPAECPDHSGFIRIFDRIYIVWDKKREYHKLSAQESLTAKIFLP